MNIEKEKRSIEILKTFEPQDEPYLLCYSGGKDSDTISILAKLAGVKHKRHYSNTTVDSPVTVKYIKSQDNIFISEYPMPDEFIQICQKEKNILSAANGNSAKAVEKIFTNKRTYEKLNDSLKQRFENTFLEQLSLFD